MSPGTGLPATTPTSAAIRSWVAVLAAPTVSAPVPVPGLPPVMAAGPLLPAEVTGTIPTSSMLRVSISMTFRPA